MRREPEVAKQYWPLNHLFKINILIETSPLAFVRNSELAIETFSYKNFYLITNWMFIDYKLKVLAIQFARWVWLSWKFIMKILQYFRFTNTNLFIDWTD